MNKKNPLRVNISPSNVSNLVSSNIENLKSLQFLINATSVLTESLDYEETLAKVAKLAVPNFADWCTVHIVDDNNIVQQIIVEHKDPTKIKWALKLQRDYPPRPDSTDGIRGVLKNGKSVMMSEIPKELLYAAARDAEHLKIIKKLRLKSYMSVPLKARGKTLGVLSFVSAESNRLYNMNDLSVVEDLARIAGIAIDNARLYASALKAQKTAQQEMEKRKKEEEQSLKLSEIQQKRLETILNVMPMALVLVEQKTGNILFSNKAAGLITDGYSAKFRAGNTDGYFATDATGNIIEKQQWPVNQVADGKKLDSFFMEWHTPKGKVALLNSSQLLPMLKSSPKTGVLVIQDITSLKRLENQKDEFISMASHELKTPVTTIKGFTQILQNLFDEDSKASYYLTRMNDQVDRLTELVNDLLDVSKIQQGKLGINKESLNLGELVTNIVTDIQPSSSHQIIVENKLDINVEADKYRLSQVIINLLTNAIKYSPKKDKVFVRTQTNGSYIKIQVQDFGIGISPRQMEKIFEPFFQADNKIRQSYGGLVLGLHISNEIIKNHQGKILVESQKGQGSTFTVLLPK